MAEKGSSALVGIIVFGNVVIMLSGLALFAETIWATTDPYKVYPILGVTGKDDVFAGGWIAIFCGFSLFVLALYGIVSAMRGSRTMLMVYLVFMMIVYIFECASCITSFTHRDYMINSNVIKQQMLAYYLDTSPQGVEITNTWNRMMLEKSCCGFDGPQDWISYGSKFRSLYAENDAPWPYWCCTRDANFQLVNQQGCLLGYPSFINSQGCSSHIVNAINSYTWGISWFGFAILMWTMLVLFVTMYHYTTLS
ncbi:uroplakin-1a [Pelobates fuscus]|uniref:uroplakin-1a n=1 Tax=Pelobates fuscus TaxID=191477 RepID=UPI002FE434E8